MPTAHELLMQEAAAALASAGLSVVRHQADDEWRAEDCPMVFLRRLGATRRDGAPFGRVDLDCAFAVHAVVSGTDWEAAADALHHDAHRALTASVLAARDLQLASTEPRAVSGDTTLGEIVATYTVMVRTDDNLDTLA